MRAPRGLHTLARIHGLQTAYHDHDGRRVTASPEGLMATLQALGVEVREAADIAGLIVLRRRELAERALGPVTVVRVPEPGSEGGASCRLRTPAGLEGRPVRVSIELEDGGERSAAPDPSTLEVTDSHDVGGRRYIDRTVPLPAVPSGYHRLRIELPARRATRRHESLLIAAPRRAVGWDALAGRGAGTRRSGRHWGLFAPLYALRESESAGAPEYALLDRLAEEAASHGASVIGTLPLLAAFLDRPYEPSPYMPVSRLFWNELYVAATDGEAATASGAEPGSPRLDLRAVMAARRPALEAEARELWEEAAEAAEPEEGGIGSAAPAALASFLARNPLAEDYARFRALTEANGPWDRWPARLRSRDIRRDDYDDGIARYHLYAQWRAERQLATATRRAADRGVSLYLDLPLGVHPAGYDCWRERALFAMDASAGAPPDPLAAGGQEWGFPPLDPEASRRQGHRYFIASIRKHLRFAGVLRIDHIMQAHRLYWVATGDPREGVYVRYPADELYAILCLESQRAGAVIVGEDLGTVPREVRRTMRRHGLPGMHVVQFELRTGARESADDGEPVELVPKRVREGALASIGTHDTPTFAGWWRGTDIGIRRELGRVEADRAETDLAERAVMRERLARGLGLGPASGTGRAPGADPDVEERARRVQEALLTFLGRSKAGLVLATLEDLWLEEQPQNVPGTIREENWTRRMKRPLESLSDPEVERLLEALDDARAEAAGGPDE